MLASMTAWICSLFPAVMFEMVQQASLRMPFLDELSKFNNHGRALKLMMTWNVAWYVRTKMHHVQG